MTAVSRIVIFITIIFAVFALPARVLAQTVIKCCNCNKTVETLPSGFGEDRSVLRICDECRAKRCTKIAEIRALLEKIIRPEPLHSQTVNEWRQSMSANKNSLDIYMGGLERSYCEDENVVTKIRGLRKDLQQLNPGPEYASRQLLREKI